MPTWCTFRDAARARGKTETLPRQATGLMNKPPPEYVGHEFHWIQFCDDKPIVWEWNRLHEFWIGTPWHYKSAPGKPNAGWFYLGPALPPQSGGERVGNMSQTTEQPEVVPITHEVMELWEKAAIKAFPHVVGGQINWPMMVCSLIAEIRAAGRFSDAE